MSENENVRIRTTETMTSPSEEQNNSYVSSKKQEGQNEPSENEIKIELENTVENTLLTREEHSISSLPNGLPTSENKETLQTLSPTNDNNLQTQLAINEGNLQIQSSTTNENNLQTRLVVTEGTLQTQIHGDHPHAHSHVIEVEELPITRDSSIEDENNLRMCHSQNSSVNQRLSHCNCNCHLETENNQSTSTTHLNNQSESAIHINIQSNSNTLDHNNQSTSSIPSCSQSNTNVPQPSGVTTIEVTEMGLDNASFEFLRENSATSTASSTKPPTYQSLGEFYLNDEPPKYEAITGKKLADELEETPQEDAPVAIQMITASARLNFKSKIAGFFILMGICLITGLLVYLSITSENNADPTGRS